MAINRSVNHKPVSVAEAQLARVAGEGCARHAHVNALLEVSGPLPPAISPMPCTCCAAFTAAIPGLIELALQRCPKGEAKDWLDHAAEAFERERLYLVRLTSAVGPLPSTPGAAETETSLVAARHALETLAQSERKGCALGAATAWSATGGRSAGCSTAPRPAPASSARRRHCPTKRRSSKSSIARRIRPRANGRWPLAASNCFCSTAPCSTCSRQGPPPAPTSGSGRERQLRLFCSFGRLPGCATLRLRCGLALREQQARQQHHRAERQISGDRQRRAQQDASRRTARAGTVG